MDKERLGLVMDGSGAGDGQGAPGAGDGPGNAW